MTGLRILLLLSLELIGCITTRCDALSHRTTVDHAVRVARARPLFRSINA